MRRTAGLVVCVFALSGCEPVQDFFDRSAPAPPTAEEVREHYDQHRGLESVRMTGNVAEVHFEQPYDQLDRGGSLWARVGPYVYLMTPSTRAAFSEHPGLAAVRVITHLPHGEEVARAMLTRDALSDIKWQRTLNILGHALQSGQESPRRLEELTEWSEQHTQYDYNPEYIPDN